MDISGSIWVWCRSVLGSMGCNQESFTLVWRDTGSLPNGRLSQVTRRLGWKLFTLSSYTTTRILYSISYVSIWLFNLQELAVLAYQTFMYNLKDYVINEPAAVDGLTGPEFAVQYPEQLGAVLDGLTSLISAFQITWRESVETICLFGFTQLLMRNPNLSPKVRIVTFFVSDIILTYKIMLQGRK